MYMHILYNSYNTPLTIIHYLYFFISLEEGVQRVLCTEPIYKERNSCRNCTNSSKWRCDSGWCIDRNKIQDGIPDCPDDISDEHYGKKTLFVNIWNLIPL